VAAFVDTNVVVYAFDRSDERKRLIALEIMEQAEDPIVVSTQVLNEFYWAVTRKLDPPLSQELAQEAVKNLAVGRVVPFDADLVLEAIAISRVHDITLWDAGIVSAASRAGSDILLTEDLNDGQVISGVTIRNPFAS